ncbi:MAG: DUF1549 and DUF1553 domain-containing protein [Limisphaerales bacterium]
MSACLFAAWTFGLPAAEHWAFVRGPKPVPPRVNSAHFVRNPIDRFVVARLEQADLTLSDPADRHTLIRRLSLDLLGLQPSPEEVNAFVSNQSSDAYEQLVDRLLVAPQFGERWGRHWLDLARYGDSDGYLGDGLRPHAWVYRDWVIGAINRDMPFDRFTEEQLAGDLLPQPKVDQLIAVGFHRNTLKNTEAGADRELNRTKEVIDRVNTTGTVWLGLTVGCAECHDHKHDPISQAEFYGLYSFFNNTDEVTHSAPQLIEMRRYDLEAKSWNATYSRLNGALERFEKNQLPERFANWLSKQERSQTKWTIMKPDSATGVSNLKIQTDDSVVATGNPSTVTSAINVSNSPPRVVNAIRLELFGGYGSGEEKGNAVGQGKNGKVVVSSLAFAVVPPGTKGFGKPFKSVVVSGGFGGQDAIDSRSNEGWTITNHTRRYYSAVFKLREPAEVPQGSRLLFAMRQKEGKYNTMKHFRISITDETNAEPTVVPDDLGRLVGRGETFKRTVKEWNRLRHHYCQLDEDWVRLRKPIEYHVSKRPKKPATRAQSMKERTKDRREAYIHVRGDYSRKGKTVVTGTPGVMHALAKRAEQPDRLDLARWLTSRENPLTSRVIVNRIWQRLFGVGIVASSDDFGTKGSPPSHPDLLDWMALELEERNWSRKAIIRQIVLSSTYRQSSAMRPELADHPTGNRLLWRQNSFRLSAEAVRDVHLVASGLYDATIGGPGIRPPLPEFVTEVGRSVKWPVSAGGDRYRRGMYIFFKRTVPYPMLISFDAPDSSVSCSRRERTNSPLQALTLLNDPVFFECAEVLGKQFANAKPESAIREMFHRCLGRDPSGRELAALSKAHADLAALKEIDPMIGLARIVMNLDEFITRD